MSGSFALRTVPWPSAGNRRWYAVAALLLLAGLVHLVVFAVGDRPWEGPVSWRKPATFGLSFGVTLATITWVSGYLRMRSRTRSVLLTVFALDCILEVSLITLQAWRDVPSHVNTTTPFDATVAYALAFGGAVLVVVLGSFGAVAVRGRTQGGPELVTALRWGFVYLFAALLAGAAMIAYGTVTMRRGDVVRAYDVTGFLKGFHGVTLHAVLVLPALAAWLQWRQVEPARRLLLVRLAAGLYGLVAAAVLVQNLAPSLG